MDLGNSTDQNAEAILAWDTVLFEKFSRFRHTVTVGFSGHSDGALALDPPLAGARVLDVGCGFGDLTQVLARAVGPRGEAVGLDAAAHFVESARRDAEEAALSNARFVVGDAQAVSFDEPFDAVYSRFGTMFFSSPVAALRNIRSALKPGAKLCMVVWRRREDNVWVHAAEQVVRPMIPLSEESREPTCGPGPFSMASADVVSDIVVKAGYKNVTLTRQDIDIRMGRDLEDAVAFAMALGPAGEILRLAGDEGERRRPQVIAALKDALSSFEKADGVWASSSSWIVTAAN